jgi:AbrB family looped-hinge helix DNA binding protein
MYLNQSTITKRWQTVIPAAIRKQLKAREGDKLVWIADGTSIRVIVLPQDPLKALRGSGKGEGLLAKLLEERKQERERERQR